ncbi:YdcF family protein [Microbaculum marinum]|uniref:YdcF family protein n=2 Tax=Microbaculum marinum TaxID=1764581 RepID=A0AAW9RZ33_9HYPH
MFFYLSKIAWFFLQPSNLLVLLAVAGALLLLGRYRRLGGSLLGLALAGLLICGFSPFGQLLVLPLEERFPQWQQGSGPPPDGIVVLGGSFDTAVSAGRETVTTNEAGERLTAFAELARRFPDAKLVFTGGSGRILFDGATEAEIARSFFTGLGIDPARVILEDRSRNTWQNAVFTRDLVDPNRGERWLLVTSATHMPRAVGCFRAAGFDVEAYPVDYRTRGWSDLRRPFSAVSEGLRRVDTGMREWIGLVAYRATGRTQHLFPAP